MTTLPTLYIYGKLDFTFQPTQFHNKSLYLGGYLPREQHDSSRILYSQWLLSRLDSLQQGICKHIIFIVTIRV